MATASVSLVCPIDQLRLSVVNITVRSNTPDDESTHVHVRLNGTLTCSNGHQWLVDSDVLLVRGAS